MWRDRQRIASGMAERGAGPVRGIAATDDLRRDFRNLRRRGTRRPSLGCVIGQTAWLADTATDNPIVHEKTLAMTNR